MMPEVAGGRTGAAGALRRGLRRSGRRWSRSQSGCARTQPGSKPWKSIRLWAEKYRFDIVEDGGRMVVVGTYLVLDRPHMIRFTWSCSTWADPTHESIVTVEIRPAGEDGAHMTIRHEHLPHGTAENHRHGWSLDRRAARCGVRRTVLERVRQPSRSALHLPISATLRWIEYSTKLLDDPATE